jgi:5-methylcytosine-specific restriction endonuclease McrA
MVAIKPKTKLWELQVPLCKGGNKGKCEKCGKEGFLTLDHIIPVSFLESLYADYELFGKEGGVDMVHNDRENIELVCSYCNRQKANRIDIRHPKTLYLLEKLVNFLKVNNMDITKLSTPPSKVIDK